MLAKILTNHSHEHFENMKSQFTKYVIEDEKDFEEALYEIVDLTIQSEFKDKEDKIREFLFFQEIDVVMYRLEIQSPSCVLHESILRESVLRENVLRENVLRENVLRESVLRESILRESLKMLLENYTYEMYLDQQMYGEDNYFINSDLIIDNLIIDIIVA
jgi:hypothetical protein